MKKLFAVLVALAMALSCAAIQVFASNEPCFYVEAYNANVGDEVVIPVMLSDYEGNAHILNMQLNYETDALAVTEIDNGEFLTNAQSAMVIVDYSSIPGSIRIGVACAINPVPIGSDPMTIVNVHFTVLEGASNAVNTLELVVAEFVNFPIGGSAEDIEHTIMDGAITVGTTDPVTDTPAPVTDTPLPVTDTPAPVTDTPVPVTDTPVPVTDTPVPATNTPSPVTDTPVPVTDSPVTEIPSTNEPSTDVPATDEPVTEVPITDEPISETPITDVPNPTGEPDVTIAPTEIAPVPSEKPANPPSTGAATIIGLGISAAVIGTGALLFRRKED